MIKYSNIEVTGSVVVTGSLVVSGTSNITASLATNAVSASHALRSVSGSHAIRANSAATATTSVSSSFTTQVRTTSGTTDTTTWVPLVGNNITGGQPLVLDTELTYNAVTHILNTTSSLATQRTTRPHYISARKSFTQGLVSSGTDVTFDTVSASNGLSITSNTSISLTGGKVYLINASFAAQDFSNTTGGFITFTTVNASNTEILNHRAVLVPESFTGSQATNPTLTVIYAPVSNITIKFRCIGSNGTATLREDMTHFTITEII